MSTVGKVSVMWGMSTFSRDRTQHFLWLDHVGLKPDGKGHVILANCVQRRTLVVGGTSSLDVAKDLWHWPAKTWLPHRAVDLVRADWQPGIDRETEPTFLVLNRYPGLEY